MDIGTDTAIEGDNETGLDSGTKVSILDRTLDEIRTMALSANQTRIALHNKNFKKKKIGWSCIGAGGRCFNVKRLCQRKALAEWASSAERVLAAL
ncbi:hypothetical protein EVAR_17335_1 [Eumeta japonica]|uniref:Uncharacterized protein n=1 Tax=Eumeta variegata TaxID=151549 RepID=A0A4C1TTA7_EUMVA|nr:hypothetical protein EVAR_17335_1 [Eumeta japonica]